MKNHVVIVGGGFAGLACARKLAEDKNIRITLIDKHDYQQFQPLLYQLATSQLSSADVASPLRRFFEGNAAVDVKMAEIVKVDPLTKTVKTKEGQSYQGDFLVLAAGSQANFFETQGAAQNTFPLYSLYDAERLRSRILNAFEDADRDPSLIGRGALNFIIVGAGPTGVEMAGALADMVNDSLPKEFMDLNVKEAKVYLVDGGSTILRPFSDKAQNYAIKELEIRGVRLHLGVEVKKVAFDRVLLSDGKNILTRTVIWAGGLKASNLADHSSLPQGHGGRIEVQSDLTVQGFPEIYVLGDFANIPSPGGQTFPQLASVAQQCGYAAAKNIIKQLNGHPKEPFHYRDKGIMAMIGRNAAVAEIGKKRHELDGALAFAAWLGVHAALLGSMRQKIESVFEWAWDYFGKTHGMQISDRMDSTKINWNQQAELEESIKK